MSLIGVMSDSHDNLKNIEKAVNIFNEKNVALVIHCGDYIAPFVFKVLSRLRCKLVGVFGNNDGEKELLLKFSSKYGFDISGSFKKINLNDRSIGILHGIDGSTIDFVYGLASTGKYDIILYGHTHKAHVERKNNVLIVNPGETFGLLYGKATVALVNLEKMTAELIKLE